MRSASHAAGRREAPPVLSRLSEEACAFGRADGVLLHPLGAPARLQPRRARTDETPRRRRWRPPRKRGAELTRPRRARGGGAAGKAPSSEPIPRAVLDAGGGGGGGGGGGVSVGDAVVSDGHAVFSDGVFRRRL